MALNLRKMYPVQTAILDNHKLTREIITDLADSLESVIADVEKDDKPNLTSSHAALARLAFERAIEEGRLNGDEHAEKYAGNYMYMGKDKHGNDAFKNSLTRQYLKV
jgi:hypothetical protein